MKSLISFQNSWNKGQSTGDFMLDTAIELLPHSHAESSSELDSSVEGGKVLNAEERQALMVQAADQNRHE